MRIIIINCFDTIEHRAELLRKIMRQEGHDVFVLTSDYRHIHKSRRIHAPDDYELIRVTQYIKNLSIARMVSHSGFARHAVERVKQIKPDLLWVMIPPNSLGKRVAEYKKIAPHCKVVFDIIDMWPESLPILRYKKFPPLTNWAALRNKALSKADLVVSESNLYWDILRKYCPAEKQTTLYLAKEKTEFAYDPDLPEDRISLCYLGSINNIIDIPLIYKIIKAIPAPVELNIIGDGESREELIQKAENAGAHVVYHGIVYDQKLKQEIFDRCHFGLNIMKDTVYVGLTMKSIDYWEASLPIINNIKGDTWKFVEQKEIGINYNGEDTIPLLALTKIQERRRTIRSFFEDYFTEDIFAEQVIQILKDI